MNESCRFALRECGSLTSIVGLIHELGIHDDKNLALKRWYRGHSNSEDKLVPTIGREHATGEATAPYSALRERDLLHRFRRRAYAVLGRNLDAGEALILGRHHRLPTRLLDWTAIPLIALYFAVHEKKDADGRFYALLRRSKPTEIDVFDFAKWSEDKLFDDSIEPKIKILHPFYNSPRLAAQDGIFTVHWQPSKSLEELQHDCFERQNLDIERIDSWTIPKGHKHALLRQLSALGISHRTVFPDLDGIAKSLVDASVLWAQPPQGVGVQYPLNDPEQGR